MRQNQVPLRGASIPVLVILALLLAGSLYYFRQRMLFADGAFMTFNLLNEGRLLIQEHRYGAFVTQAIPLLGGWLHLPLSIILLLYSAGFQLFYLAVGLLLLYRLRQPALAVLLVCYLTVFASDVFFWPNNEVHQGVAWMLLSLGILLRPTTRPRLHYPLLAVTAFLALFSHFLVALPFLYLLLYFLADGRLLHLGRFGNLLLLGGFAALFGFKYWLGLQGWYDGPKLEGVKQLSAERVLNAFQGGQLQSMGPRVLTDYWWAPVLLVGGLAALIFARKWVQLLLTIFFILLTVVLLATVYPDAFDRSLLFYMESEWMVLGLIAAAPFVLEVLPRLQRMQVVLFVLLLGATRLWSMEQSAGLFTRRMETIQSINRQLHQQGIHKALVVKDVPTAPLFLAEWGVPVESLLSSRLDGHHPQVTFRLVEAGETPISGTDSFQTSFRTLHQRALNGYYFQTDTTQGYKVVRLSELVDTN